MGQCNAVLAWGGLGGLSWAVLYCQCIRRQLSLSTARALYPLLTAACLPCHAIPCRSTRLLSQPRGEWDMVTRMSSNNLDAFLDRMLTGNTGMGALPPAWPGLAWPSLDPAHAADAISPVRVCPPAASLRRSTPRPAVASCRCRRCCSPVRPHAARA